MLLHISNASRKYVIYSSSIFFYSSLSLLTLTPCMLYLSSFLALSSASSSFLASNIIVPVFSGGLASVYPHVCMSCHSKSCLRSSLGLAPLLFVCYFPVLLEEETPLMSFQTLPVCFSLTILALL